MKCAKSLTFVSFLAFWTGLPLSAAACSDGWYMACLGPACSCLPNSGTLTLAPVQATAALLPDTIKVAGAIQHTNLDELASALGGVMTDCPECQLIKPMLSRSDLDFMQYVAGYGLIDFAATGDPYVVAADVVYRYATRRSISSSAPPIPVAPAPTRTPKLFTSKATCLVGFNQAGAANDGRVVAGWSSGAFSATDDSGAAVTDFDNNDFRPGDTLQITSDNSNCASLGNYKSEHYITSVKMKVVSQQVVPNSTQSMMVDFVIGSSI